MTATSTNGNGNGAAAPFTALAIKDTAKTLTPGQQLNREFAKWKPTLAALLPKHLDPERIIKMAMGAYMRDEKLRRCTMASIVKATIMAAELGLEPGGVLGEAYLVPFNNMKEERDGNTTRKVKVTEATLIPGYKGLVKLARQSGDVASVYACVVDSSEAADFRVTLGTTREIKHEMNMTDSRKGDFFAVYAVIRFKDGSDPHFEVMTKNQVDAIRKRSAASDDGPWKTDYDWMAKKTCLKQALKLVTLSPEKPQLATALAADNASESGEAFNTDLTAEFEVVDPSQGATAAIEAQKQTVPSDGSRASELSSRLDHDPVTGEVK